MSTEQSAWDAGYRAGVKGKSRDACPYPTYSIRRGPWMEGYRIAIEPMRSAKG